MADAAWHILGAFEVGIGASIAPVGDLLWEFGVDRVADLHIKDVASDEPDEHEGSKGDVARCFEV